ncbi:hypothetical protein AB0C38_47300 [Amycolatopsis sp. NPDC048633]|uniref:hypothetical protein n=1 Tax=Amycolatopsis sp. NPDC048633 TaxID=3157095 RepID=UPI0033E75855
MIGSVRHYFATHDEMIVFAMRVLAERTTTRILGHAERLLGGNPPEDRLEATTRLLGELLPLDESRAAEAEVCLAFTIAARSRPDRLPPRLAEDVLRRHLDSLRTVSP